ncbi:MAG: arsenate reductase (glutaredoxin) [Bacteroidota bacterium]|nr:arsenate reductase (glutaredoxin) [Bacteroidota bacterium]
MPYTIYHNPRCSTSRAALELLREKGIEPKVIEYMKDVPTEREMEMLLMKLHIKAEDLVRKSEAIFKGKFKGLEMNEHEWVRIMREYPQLIERPIVMKGHKAVIGRPIDRIKELL